MSELFLQDGDDLPQLLGILLTEHAELLDLLDTGKKCACLVEGNHIAILALLKYRILPDKQTALDGQV